MVSRAVSSSTGVLLPGAHAPQDFETVDAGQADVEHQHGRIETLRQRIVAVVDGMHGETMRIEHTRQTVGEHRVVFDQQNIHRNFEREKQRKTSA
jgi:hypothetical protein